MLPRMVYDATIVRKNLGITDIIFNQDYTPYAKKRDLEIEKFCDKNKINSVFVFFQLICYAPFSNLFILVF